MNTHNQTHRQRWMRPALILAAGLASLVSAQDRRDYRQHEGDPFTRIEPGVRISVRTNTDVDSDRTDYRVYTATVSADVRAGNSRVAIPRGSQVELIVRRTADNSLTLDLESVTVGGVRYALTTDTNRVQSQSDGESPLVGAIIGAITRGQASGRRVQIRRETALTFRLEQPLDMGVPDRGQSRDGVHYHDYYRPR